MSSTFGCTLVLALCLGSSGIALAGEQRVSLQPGGLRLSADELSYRPGQGRLELRGRVSLELGALRLRAARITLAVDPKGQPFRAEAQGSVEVRAGDASGRADQASLQLATRVLELSGAARVKLGSLGLELAGDRMEVDLASGGLRVRGARARLDAPPARGASHAGR